MGAVGAAPALPRAQPSSHAGTARPTAGRDEGLSSWYPASWTQQPTGKGLLWIELSPPGPVPGPYVHPGSLQAWLDAIFG